MNKITEISVGVDVSKNTLDVCFHQTKSFFKIENSHKGINLLLKKLANFKVDKIVFEASGGYEQRLLLALEEAEHNYWRVNPIRVKGFIASEGTLAKTDKSDAKMLALFAYKKDKKNENVKVKEEERRLQCFFRRRRGLKRMIVTKKQRLDKPMEKYCKTMIMRTIKFFEKQIKSLDKEISKLISDNKNIQRKIEIIESVPGLGKESSSALVIEMPELGKIRNKQAAALLGVAPCTKESGTYRGRAIIKAGRRVPRKVIYMAALTASRFNPDFAKFYKRLRKNGKPGKVALVAVMRKLVELVNTLLKENRLWENRVLERYV